MSMNGIDISNWQNGINLDALQYDFVIMKATQGTSFVSPDFHRQYQQAKNANKCIGIYHYATGINAIQEADFFLQTVNNFIGEAILVLDWEGRDNVAWAQSPAYAKQFLDRVYEKTKVRAFIYMSKSVCREFDWSLVAKTYELWVAQYANNETTGYKTAPWTDEKGYGAWEKPLIFQYTSSGRLEGYDGNLDLDIAYMDATEWKRHAAKEAIQDSVSGTTIELVALVMQGKYGNGENRKQALGNRYSEVMKVINHIANAEVDVLATETIQGKYGNGEIRKIILGSKYATVQKRVNERLRSK